MLMFLNKYHPANVAQPRDYTKARQAGQTLWTPGRCHADTTSEERAMARLSKKATHRNPK